MLAVITGIFRPISRSLRELALNRKLLILTLAAITLVVFLAGLFMLLLHAVDSELGKTRGEALFQVYWQPGSDPQKVQSQLNNLKSLPDLTAIKTFTPEEGLSVLARNLSNDDMSWLKNENPIPYTALLSFASKGDGGWADATTAMLRAMPGVAMVSFNNINTDLSQAWAGFSHKVIWPVIIFLGLVLGLIVGNTIKLSLMHRRNEIEIYRLVGAKPWFILAPLMMNGALQGFLGGLAALILLKFTQMSLSEMLNFPPLSFLIEFLPFRQILLLLLLPALVGMAASWLAARD